MINFRKTGVPHDSRARYKYYPVEEGRMVRILVSYGEGGRNYGTGKVDPRGIRMNLTCITATTCGRTGMRIETSEPFDGGNGNILLLETSRYSARKLAEVVEKLDPHAPEISALWGVDQDLAIALVRRLLDDQMRKAA